MARAFLEKELCFETKDETGTLGFITISLKEAKINIVHLSAYAHGKTAFFQIVVSDAAKAREILSNEIKNVEVREVLIVEFENAVGTLSDVAKLLGSNSIGMNECYGTSSDGFKIVGVFCTSDNQGAVKLINDASGHLSVNRDR